LLTEYSLSFICLLIVLCLEFDFESVRSIVPECCRGTHQWDRFITPEELAIMASKAGLTLSHLAGIQLQPRLPGTFALTDDTSVNYIAAFHKP